MTSIDQVNISVKERNPITDKILVTMATLEHLELIKILITILDLISKERIEMESEMREDHSLDMIENLLMEESLAQEVEVLV
jgi:hypothetical protein